MVIINFREEGENLVVPELMEGMEIPVLMDPLDHLGHQAKEYVHDRVSHSVL